MAGVDKIISRIREESEAAAAKTLADANAQADQILMAARVEAEKEQARISGNASRSAEGIRARGSSSAALRIRQGLLAEKQRLIGEVIEEAKAEIAAMPVETYFDWLIRLAGKEAWQGEGELLLSPADRARVPADFQTRLDAALAGRGASLAVSDETREMTAGFVLVYGDVEENVSVDAIVEASRDSLSDLVQGILFP